jgi:hypothetical protein
LQRDEGGAVPPFSRPEGLCYITHSPAERKPIPPPGGGPLEKKRIAIIGASQDRKKYGNIAVRAYLQQGYEVYPVTPKSDEVEGQKAYPSVGEIPVKELYVNPGAESDELLEKAKALGLNTIVACSIKAVGLRPEEV